MTEMLSLYIIINFSCIAGKMNRLENDVTKDYFEVECQENNQFKSVEWPTCKDSK